jgi:hypothetical protein
LLLQLDPPACETTTARDRVDACTIRRESGGSKSGCRLVSGFSEDHQRGAAVTATAIHNEVSHIAIGNLPERDRRCRLWLKD